MPKRAARRRSLSVCFLHHCIASGLIQPLYFNKSSALLCYVCLAFGSVNWLAVTRKVSGLHHTVCVAMRPVAKLIIEICSGRVL